MLNKVQRKRINRAVKLAQWDVVKRKEQKRINVLCEEKNAHNAIQAVIWRG